MPDGRAQRAARFVFDNSLLLIAGAVAGVVWANVDRGTYDWFSGARILAAPWPGPVVETAPRGITLHYLVNDVLMALFFGLAAKEVWGAMLPGGHLRDPRRASLPVVAALGGMAGPALIYSTGALALGQIGSIGRGWAIPTATDIAFSYMIARLIFGRLHPAVPFLLLLAIADDAFGLIIIALFYPQKAVQPVWLLLPVCAVLLGLAMRRLRVGSFWWYLVFPGALSWAGIALSGIHPALGLLPIIPTMPHARTAEAQVRWGATPAGNALDRFGTVWKKPVEIILAFFGLLNAGVTLSGFGIPTYLVLGGLLFGKPIGIFTSAFISSRFLGLRLPAGLGLRELLAVGCAGGIGFTVALFVATVAFPPGPYQDASKMGALCSCLAALTTVLAARLLRVRRMTSKQGAAGHAL